MATALETAGDWTMELVIGDFNENPTLSQIITNTLITMIPYVDQAADLRDIAACFKQLVWDGHYKQPVVWAGLALTLIGMVPFAGSLVI